MADKRENMDSGEEDEDVYTDEGIEELEEDDEISAEEGGFMEGELKAEGSNKELEEEGNEVEVGKVNHYFTKIGVAIVEITDGELNVGDTIHIKGANTDLNQPVESMQINHKNVSKAKVGDQIGMKVLDHVREHDKVYVVKSE